VLMFLINIEHETFVFMAYHNKCIAAFNVSLHDRRDADVIRLLKCYDSKF